MLWAAAGTIAAAVLLALALWWLARRAQDERKRAAGQFLSDLARHGAREARSAERLADRAERACRAAAIAGLLAGAKCRGCGLTVKRDDLAPAGEDAKGRPVELCSDCRKLIGIKDSPKEEP